MLQATILPELGEKCKNMALGHILCNVVNTKYNEDLWEEIQEIQEEIRLDFEMHTIKNQINIEATRKVYRACGKDPHRYRPAAESLFRRIIKGYELYQINTVVDVVNYFSLISGYSLGAFDAEKIQGSLTAGVGKKDEPYEGIGRGILNIEGLPVLRDEIGGIGTPTSDEVRTAIDMNTKQLFINFNGYIGKEKLIPFMEKSVDYLKKYCSATYRKEFF